MTNEYNIYQCNHCALVFERGNCPAGQHLRLTDGCDHTFDKQLGKYDEELVDVIKRHMEMENE